MLSVFASTLDPVSTNCADATRQHPKPPVPHYCLVELRCRRLTPTELNSMTMGGGPEPKSLREKILVALPGARPDHLLERLKKKFPDVEIDFTEIAFKLDPDVPKGALVWLLFSCACSFAFSFLLRAERGGSIAGGT